MDHVSVVGISIPGNIALPTAFILMVALEIALCVPLLASLRLTRDDGIALHASSLIVSPLAITRYIAWPTLLLT